MKKSRFSTKSGTKNSTKKSRFSNCNILFFPSPKILPLLQNGKKNSLGDHVENSRFSTKSGTKNSTKKSRFSTKSGIKYSTKKSRFSTKSGTKNSTEKSRFFTQNELNQKNNKLVIKEYRGMI